MAISIYERLGNLREATKFVLPSPLTGLNNVCACAKIKSNFRANVMCGSLSESIFRVNSEPESYPSPSQAESQASGLPFRQSSLRSDIRRDRDDKTSGN